MPVLPQAFWYNVDGKLKQVFFEEAKIPQEKRDALLKQLQRTRNYAGGAASAPVPDEVPVQNTRAEKEKLYGWYPLAPGAQFMTVTQARLDKRVFKPNEIRPVPIVPDDRLREPISTQIGPDGAAPCIPPFATDPMAYKFSMENTTQLPTVKASPDFGAWAVEETGHIPQWNDVVAFHGTPLPPDRPRTIVLPANDADVHQQTLAPPEQQRRPLTQPMPTAGGKSPAAPPVIQRSTTPQTRRTSARGGVRIEATPVIVVGNNNNSNVFSSSLVVPSNSNTDKKRHSVTSSLAAQTQSLSLREIQEMQKKLSTEYRWRFNVHGDPFAVKSKVRPGRPAHWMPAKAEAPKPGERHIHYADSSCFFYNTIPIIPLSFSVGQGLASEKVIRDRQAKQKFAPKSTPNDRYFVPSFIY